jgi:hypothetical protein
MGHDICHRFKLLGDFVGMDEPTFAVLPKLGRFEPIEVDFVFDNSFVSLRGAHTAHHTFDQRGIEISAFGQILPQRFQVFFVNVIVSLTGVFQDCIQVFLQLWCRIPRLLDPRSFISPGFLVLEQNFVGQIEILSRVIREVFLVVYIDPIVQ